MSVSDRVQMNLYQFAGNRPTVLVDPTGTDAQHARPDLGVSARQVTQFVRSFRGRTGEGFKQRVAATAAKVGVNPGFLAANLLAETDRGAFMGGTVDSFSIGTDDYYNRRADIQRKVPAARGVRTERGSLETATNENNREVNTITFASGQDALLAFAAYLKWNEITLREMAREMGGDFDALPVDVRWMLVRYAFNQGPNDVKSGPVEGAGYHLRRLIKEGKNPMVTKSGRFGPQRAATVHGAAQAPHLSKEVFGVDPQ
jgi:hypothetical protein